MSDHPWQPVTAAPGTEPPADSPSGADTDLPDTSQPAEPRGSHSAPESVLIDAGSPPVPALPPFPTQPPDPVMPLEPVARRGLSSRVAGLSPATALAVGCGLGAAAVGLAWVSVSLGSGEGSPATPKTFTATGVMTLTAGGHTYVSDNCTGTSGYDDIQGGASVTVYDASGTVVANGSLEPGSLDSTNGCAFPFTVEGVPAGSQFYKVEVSHRGALVQSAEEMQLPLAFTLG